MVFTSILEHFEGDIVTVTVEWMEENLIYLYNITVTPQAETTFIGKATVQLKIIYNTFYNVSVITSSPCGSSNVTNLTDLFYSELMNTYLHSLI